MKGILKFIAGIALGYGAVQGIAYLQQNYLWTFFYH